MLCSTDAAKSLTQQRFFGPAVQIDGSSGSRRGLEILSLVRGSASCSLVLEGFSYVCLLADKVLEVTETRHAHGGTRQRETSGGKAELAALSAPTLPRAVTRETISNLSRACCLVDICIGLLSDLAEPNSYRAATYIVSNAHSKESASFTSPPSTRMEYTKPCG